jgi:hypothetical protein
MAARASKADGRRRLVSYETAEIPGTSDPGIGQSRPQMLDLTRLPHVPSMPRRAISSHPEL